MIIGGVIAVLALVAIVFFVVPAVKGFFAGEDTKVTAGQQVTVTIPDGASGDTIASILSENHIVEDPKDYYAAVKKLNADMSLKPGTYSFTTLMDATKVVQQLMGHAHYSTTIDIYTHISEEMMGNELEKFKVAMNA